MKTFEEAWAEKEKAGYQYGKDALEQVRLGWEMRARCEIEECQSRRDPRTTKATFFVESDGEKGDVFFILDVRGGMRKDFAIKVVLQAMHHYITTLTEHKVKHLIRYKGYCSKP